ncbi:MAG: asparagine synthase (glutamine-hydrolyzing), partial [Chloroflexi bacterium]|nr:asparagine synthase (glutamine-hydrolyzing) [Chloroflexota bacterium]
MCGIAGTLNLDNSRVDKRALHRMMGSLVHRGPDDEGIYVDGPVGLGFRRLSIIDLEGGHQPLSNEDGSIWIIFNGEVYNFQELRQDLEKRGHQFRTYTDTETIVHLYEENGPRCVEKLNGMFAFALWDAKRRRLVLARDRLGVKPLCYHLDGRRLAFGSEIQALLTDPDLSRELDPVALAQYLKLWYIPSPRTIFKSIRKLPPAHLLICEKGQVRLERYWKLDFSRKLDLTDAEWGERILDLLKDAVRIRLISDVPLGAFLSGGIDSSMVVALMSQATSRPVKTFSIGFDDEAFNELPYARQVAKRFGTAHYEEIVRPDAAQV